MNRLLRIFITLIGMIMVVIFSMNSVLFITHPDLSYGTEGMFHISFIFMLFSFGILFFLSKLNENYIEVSYDIDDSIFKYTFKHDIVILNIISIFTLITYFLINGIETSIPLLLIVFFIVILILIWFYTILDLFQKKEGYVKMILPRFISNVVFSAITVFLFIELFLYINLS